MKSVTPKEMTMLNHYRSIIENRSFDEYDILGFLIFIRARIRSYKLVLEFCDLIAHRERNQGYVMHCIRVAIEANYEFAKKSMAVKGYNGIRWEQWKAEWN